MTIITFSNPLTIAFKKSAGGITQTFEANRPYLIASAQVDRIMRDPTVQQRAYKVSRADARITNAHRAAFRPGQSVLLYNGGGGYGDQILTWPVARFLHRQGLRVHVLTDPGNNICWWGMDFVRTVQTVPLPWDMVSLYDHFVYVEAPVNLDEHQDQEHPVDVMLRKIGFDPAAVPPQEKVVQPVFSSDETGTLGDLIIPGRTLGLYQLAAANPVRCLPPADSVHLITRLAAARPDIHWLCLHDEFVPKSYVELLNAETKQAALTNVQAFSAANLRELWALTPHAAVVVAPDSMMVHVAGALGVPCIGLWGPMDPDRRVRYYTNHHPVWLRAQCPHAPCFAYTNTFPKYCPPAPVARTACDVLASIRPEDVLALLKHLVVPC